MRAKYKLLKVHKRDGLEAAAGEGGREHIIAKTADGSKKESATQQQARTAGDGDVGGREIDGGVQASDVRVRGLEQSLHRAESEKRALER